MKEVLIIIPAYNEQDNIVRVVSNLIENYPQYDYVVVNDGSKDNTVKLCKENNFNLIDLPINLGLAGAFQAGMKYAYKRGYKYALQFDGDGQHRPEYIEDMLEKIKDNNDIVIGSRFVSEKKEKSARMMGSRLISLAIKLTTGKKIADPTSGMRLFNQKMIEKFANSMNYGPEPDTVAFLIKNKYNVSEVQVKMDDRIAGESYLNLKRSIEYMIKMGFSIMLIQFFRKK